MLKIYKTIIILINLYKCETWSLTMRTEHKTESLWQCDKENILMRPEITGGRIKLNNEELHNLCSSPV
jgi:hypothetical protein